MQTTLLWLGRVVIVLILILALAVLVLGALPTAADPQLDPSQYQAGAVGAQSDVTGLQREFPPMPVPSDNPTTPEKVELGRLLFFDPVLSASDEMACATCHHPDLGFSDGLPTSIGAGGEGVGPARHGGRKLARNAPSLWNVGYAPKLFWDGRADSLEEQALTPLTHADEMGASPDGLVAELQAIEGYVDLFEAAFDGGGTAAVTADNVVRALAAFQRTLVSRNSPFDHYAAGNRNALTPAQRRGLDLFRSAATRCFECHMPPLFTSHTFRVTGVPGSDDPGRAGVAPDAPEGAFKTPGLRNVALSAPYMHNGAFGTLKEVVDFYADGAGRAHGVENVDPFIVGFELTEQEKADLVAFLYALTDESQMPEVPGEVPSGLSVVPRIDNPTRERVKAMTAPAANAAGNPRAPTTLRVQPGESIQSVVDRAVPGDVIEVSHGIYHERVVIDLNDITVRGVPNERGEYPVLDGQNELSDGIVASGNNFEVSHLQFRNYTGNGVLVEGVTDVHFHDLVTENTGIYGVYPVQCTDVLIERVTASAVRDAAIYAGQSKHVVIRDSEAFDSVIGIEVENTIDAEIYDNHVHDNSLGVFTVVLPNLTSKVSLDTKVHNNLVVNNNAPNFAEPEQIAALIPPGVGVLLLGADEAEVYDNEIRGNRSAGTAVFGLTVAFDKDELDVGWRPEGVHLYDNRYAENGYDPAKMVRDLGVPGADVLWDGSSAAIWVDEAGASQFPPLMPTSRWPAFLRRAYWQVLNFAVSRLM